ncbi:hypothetical protein D0862_13496 [Hortaea werneckii]|uniref:Uncharacterized protein n=1 Tax=Hortaea werneckii TaxID=91943 RepID=A0A3M7EMJ4_HORWE|nr:hypothetical protein D0862_13496 [Hortaea werneckii]
MAGNPHSTCVNTGEPGAFPADRQHRVFPLFLSFRGKQTAVPLPIANGGHTPIDMNIVIGNKRRVSFGNSGDNQADGYSSITRFTAEAGHGQSSIGNDEAAGGTTSVNIHVFLPAPNAVVKPSFVSHDKEIGKLYSHFLKHKSYGGRLDLSKAQAVAMVLYKAKWPLTMEEIIAEVLTMSPTYTFEMISGKQASVFDSFTDELRLLDMDVNITPGTNGSPLISLSDSAALNFLTNIQPLPMPPDTNQPRKVPRMSYMDLPTELRLNIYEMVFSFPKSGVRVCHKGGTKLGSQELHMLTRSLNEVKSVTDWVYPAHVPPATRWQSPSSHARSLSISTVLSLLCVNKFTYHDAIGVFYNINHFHCGDVRDMWGFLRGISPSTGKLPWELQVDRRQFIKRISFNFMCGKRSYNNQTFNAIADHCPKLTHFGVYINEDEWDWPKKEAGAMYPSPTSYPGILAFYRVLQSPHLQEINLEGTCNKMKRLLRHPPLALSKVAPSEGRTWPPTSLTLKIRHANGATEEHRGRGNGRFRRVA